MSKMKFLYIQSSELSVLRKHETRKDRGFAYDPNIAQAMYESVTKTMDRLDSPIAYINMEKAVLYLPNESKPIKDKWGKVMLYGYSCSVFSGVFNKSPYFLIDFSDVNMFLFYAHIRSYKTKKESVEAVKHLMECDRLTFTKRLLAGEKSGYIKNKNYVINGEITQEYLSKYPHICRQGIVILNKGYGLGFESLIDRKPSECFQQFFNQKAIEVAS